MSNGQAKADQVRQALLNSAQALQPGTGKGVIRLGAALAALQGKPAEAAQQPAPEQDQQPQASPAAKNDKAALLITETGNDDPIKAAVQGLGFAPEQVNVKDGGRPNAEKIKQYPLVVWMLPGNWADNWPEEQKKMLRAWVESGGRLLLISYQDGLKPISEASSYGNGKATFVSGDLAAMPAAQQTKVIQGVIGQLLK
jgi:hypothetical protein